MENQDNNQWYKDGVKLIQDNLKVKANTKTAKNAILFMGDGMGITTVTAARILDGQIKGKQGEENVLSWEVFPWSGQVKTYAVDKQGADSAASATAILTGIKTIDGTQSTSSHIASIGHMTMLIIIYYTVAILFIYSSVQFFRNNWNGRER